MGDLAIRVEGLGKRYRIGTRLRYKTLRDAIAETIRAPWRSLSNVFNGHPSKADRASTDHIWALKDVSFDVKRGEVVGIIGANGAGKSTLLKILSKITEPTAGYAEVYGRVGSLLEIGTGFHPELTGRENIYLNGAILGMHKREITQQLDEIIAFADIEGFLDTPIKYYSSGMYVRLAFSVAAHLEPDVLLVDEVLAVGDMGFQRKCLGKMSEIAQGGRTIVCVSHNMATITALCSRAIWVDKGQIVANGKASEVVSRYHQGQELGRAPSVELTEALRYGAGELGRFLSIALCDSTDHLCNVIPMGQGCTIHLRIQFFKPVRAPEVGVAISNMLGQRLTRFVSSWEGLTTSVEKGEYVYEITVPHLWFVPGLYTLTIWVKQEGPISGGTDDGIEGVLVFQISAAAINGRAPYFETYCQPGETYVESRWKVRRVTDEHSVFSSNRRDYSSQA